MVLVPTMSGHEALRIQAVAACNVLNTKPEAVYDRIVFTAAQVLRAPMAMLAIVGAHDLWLKARVGPLPHDWPRPRTFCDTVIRYDDALVVGDAEPCAFFGLPVCREPPVHSLLHGHADHGPTITWLLPVCWIPRREALATVARSSSSSLPTTLKTCLRHGREEPSRQTDRVAAPASA